MRELGIENITQFARHFGLGKSTLYELVRGRPESAPHAWKVPSLAFLMQLAEALEVPTHELVYLVEPDAPGADTLRPTQVRVSVAGWVGAGPDRHEVVLDEVIWVEEGFARGKDLVAFRIRGDSMEAGKSPIYHGDTVVVNRNDKGHANSAVVARLRDDGYVCKVLKDDQFGRFLQSGNVTHTNGTPSVIQIDRVDEIVGRITRIIHDE